MDVDVAWGLLPEGARRDPFVNLGIATARGTPEVRDAQLPIDTRVVIQARPIDEVWREIRREFPGEDDSRGRPVDLTAETHWDGRGADHVHRLVTTLSRLVPPSERQDPAAILARWIGDGERPAALGPLTFLSRDNARVGEFYDGRHRAFAARLAGFAYVPVMNLAQFARSPARRRRVVERMEVPRSQRAPRERVLVYGTAKADGENHWRLGDGARKVGAATLPGFERHDVIEYSPAIVPKRGGTVTGEVYEVDPDALLALDAYEGIDWKRERVKLADGSAVWAYVHAAGAPEVDVERMAASRVASPPDGHTYGEVPIRYDKILPWRLTLDEFMHPYPKPRPGWISLFHYTPEKNVESIVRSGLSMSSDSDGFPAVFAHLNPRHAGFASGKPLVHFQAPREELVRTGFLPSNWPEDEQASGVISLARSVPRHDLLSVHGTWPEYNDVAVGREPRPGRWRSDVGAQLDDAAQIHRAYVEAAVLSAQTGKSAYHVPDRVLANYPELRDAPRDPASYKTRGLAYIAQRAFAETPKVERMAASRLPSLAELRPYVAQGECYEMAEALALKLKKYRLAYTTGAYLQAGVFRDHAWVAAPDGTIIDTTHGQFSRRTPVLIAAPGTKEHARYLATDAMTDAQRNAIYHNDPEPIVERMAAQRAWSTAQKRKLVLAAARWLNEDDPEFVEGGCGDVSTVIADLFRLLDIPGVEVVSGIATRRAKAARVYDEEAGGYAVVEPEPVWHAWLVVDGETIDPTWSARFGRKGARYDVDMGVLDSLTCALEHTGWRLDALYAGLVAAGWELPPLPVEAPARGETIERCPYNPQAESIGAYQKRDHAELGFLIGQVRHELVEYAEDARKTDLEAARKAFRAFQIDLEQHLTAEEDDIFPTWVKQHGQHARISRFRADHARIRTLTAKLATQIAKRGAGRGAAIDALDMLVSVVVAHEADEERLWPADARVERMAAAPEAGEVWYHLTDRPRFKLDPRFAPEDNAIAIEDRSGLAGIYLGQSVETWVNGHGYWRPFVVEFLVDPSVRHDPGVHGRYGGEMFVPAASFGKLAIQRIIPLDAYAREEFGDYGWVEDDLEQAFDTGAPVPQWGAGRRAVSFPGYRYAGPDVREMPLADARSYAKRVRDFAKRRLGPERVERMEASSSEPIKLKYDRTTGGFKNLPPGHAIRITRLGTSQFDAEDPLAAYVPERLTHTYAMHPDNWSNTFSSLTGKDQGKIGRYSPIAVPILPGTLVAEMGHSTAFLYRHDPKDAAAYVASLHPLSAVDIKQYERPELLIPMRGEHIERMATLDGASSAFERKLQKFAASTQKKLGLENFDLIETHDGAIKLHTIIVPKGQRGAGIGTQAMDALTAFADKHGRLIVLTPDAPGDRAGTTSKARLAKFYKQFGFVENTGRRKNYRHMERMYRKPAGVERVERMADAHDYDPAWDYEVVKRPPAKLVAAVQRATPELNGYLGALKLPAVSLIFYAKNLGGHVARYVNGTPSAPVFGIDAAVLTPTLRYGSDEVRATLFHEAGHAYLDSTDAELSSADEESVVEDAARWLVEHPGDFEMARMFLDAALRREPKVERMADSRSDAFAGVDGAAYFTASALRQALDESGSRSRTTIVAMSPGDVLALALHGPEPDKAARVHSVLTESGQFSDVPYLGFDNNGDGTGRVVAHEGRHRSRALRERGVALMPVRLISREGGNGPAIRWSVHPAGQPIDGMPWPKTLISEDGKARRPFPISVVYPGARAERMAAKKQAPVASLDALHRQWSSFAHDTEFGDQVYGDDSKLTLAAQMKGVAWDHGYEDASGGRGTTRYVRTIAVFEPLAASVGVDLRAEFDAGVAAFEASR